MLGVAGPPGWSRYRHCRGKGAHCWALRVLGPQPSAPVTLFYMLPLQDPFLSPSEIPFPRSFISLLHQPADHIRSTTTELGYSAPIGNGVILRKRIQRGNIPGGDALLTRLKVKALDHFVRQHSAEHISHTGRIWQVEQLK